VVAVPTISTQEAEAGGSGGPQWPGLQSETVSQKPKKSTNQPARTKLKKQNFQNRTKIKNQNKKLR
jgi:hypothetical protein